MKPLSVVLLLGTTLTIGTTLTACATTPRSGSEPSVPKKTIEKAADTKIEDAGPRGTDAAR